MMNTVHIDEKWFHVMPLKGGLIIASHEEIRKSSNKSKRLSTTVMFLTTVAHPRYGKHYKSYFNGKICIWPFVESTVAKRSSVNQATAVNLDKDVYRRNII